MSGTTENENPFVQWLLQQIERKGWTREEFARKAGISSGALTHIIHGDRGIGSDVARQMASALGVSQLEIFEHARIIDEELLEDEKTVREIRRLVFKMGRGRRGLALKILETMAEEDPGPALRDTTPARTSKTKPQGDSA